MQQYLYKLFCILRASFRGFIAENCSLKASSLTFYTLLSIVPMLAVAIGLAKGFGLEKNLDAEIYGRFGAQKEVIDLVVKFANSLLKETAGSYIAGVGVLFLFFFVISLFWTIESTLNEIWKVKNSRSLLRIFTDYLAMMVLIPFLIVTASSLNLLVTSFWQGAMEQNTMIKQIDTYLLVIYRIIPLLFIWALFTSIYLIMPNTKVGMKYAFMGALIAGTLYYGALIAIIQFQVGVSQYSPIYGSFAALPLFLFLLQVTWNSVLFGAEVAYHAEHLYPKLSQRGKKENVSLQIFTLLLASQIAKAFREGKNPWTLKQLSETYGVSEGEVTEALMPLIEKDKISQIDSDKMKIAYQPGQDLSHLTLFSILQASDSLRERTISIPSRDEISHIKKNLEEFDKECFSLEANRTIDSLLSSSDQTS